MTSLHSIKRLYSVIDNSLFTINGKLDYDRITAATIALAVAVHEYEGDNDDMWYIGEYGACDLASFIVGAYWHYSDCHN